MTQIQDTSHLICKKFEVKKNGDIRPLSSPLLFLPNEVFYMVDWFELLTETNIDKEFPMKFVYLTILTSHILHALRTYFDHSFSLLLLSSMLLLSMFFIFVRKNDYFYFLSQYYFNNDDLMVLINCPKQELRS